MGMIDKLLLPLGRVLWSPQQKNAPIPYSSRFSFTGGLPSKQSKESYLRYYSEIGWLRAAVSTIAQSVAQSTWMVFQKKKDGDREEITGLHDLKNILNRPNEFQSGYDFLRLHQTFYELLGESYWIKQMNQGRRELWIAPPQYMTPIPDSTKYISGYHYERGEFKRDFKPNEVIAFVDIDPLDMMRGTGRAQAVGIDIESLSFESQYNRNFFYWGADPGTVITYPVEASITLEELDRVSEQWNAGHRSYGRAHRAAILTQGATVAKEGIGQRDMDFVNMVKNGRENVLGVFGTSYSIMGGTDDINRANAEAQLVNYARWVLMPRLILLREHLNMSLSTDYGEDLELDFEDPVPEDNAQSAMIIDNHLKSSVISIEEARQQLDMGDVEPDHHFLVPFNMTIKTGEEMMSIEPAPEPAPTLPFGKPPEEIPPEKAISDPKG